MKRTLIVTAVVLSVGIALVILKKTAPPIEHSIEVTHPVQSPAPAQPSLADRLRWATAGKGEGQERPFIRQLMADPTLVEGPKQAFRGDPTDKKSLKKWAGRQAHLIAIRAGYVDWKFGSEVRVRRPGQVAYLLQKNDDGKLRVAEYATSVPGHGFGASPVPTNTLTVASSISQSHFICWPGAIDGSHVPPPPVYEYLYTAE